MDIKTKYNKKYSTWANLITSTINKFGELPYFDKFYKSYSAKKISAYNKCVHYCRDYCDKLNKNFSGYNRLHCNISDMGIISANTYQFTFAAVIKYWSENRDFVAIDYIVITKGHIYKF